MRREERRMKVIIVDDELLALSHLEKLLKANFETIEIIGTYTNPIEAKKMIRIHRPDLVFLDIEMPKMNGLQLGETIQECCPETNIVYATAYDKYAIQAFKLYAIDYILKPVRLSRLKKTIGRLQKQQVNADDEKNVEAHKTISCFNTLGVKKADGEIEVIKWRTGKSRELFAYLLHHRGQVVYRDTILDLLWSESELSRATNQLYTTIYHIRNMIKSYELHDVTINRTQIDYGYRLEMKDAKIDTVLWSDLVLQTPTEITVENLATAEHILYMYKGDYLGEYDYIWAEAERERLRMLFLNHAHKLQQFYLTEKMIDEAIKLNEYIQTHLATEEESYFNLMKLYSELGNKIAVHNQYNKLVTMMRKELDVEPSEDIVEWYDSWVNQHD